MTQIQFDQFKNKILKLSGDAEVFWEEIQALQTTKDKAIRLVREQKYQLDQRKEELKQAKDEIKDFKSHLLKAITRIKELEKVKPQLPSPPGKTPVASHPIDLNKIANDFDLKLERREKEERFNYFKKMEMGL